MPLVETRTATNDLPAVTKETCYENFTDGVGRRRKKRLCGAYAIPAAAKKLFTFNPLIVS